jgi:hypothetical protein
MAKLVPAISNPVEPWGCAMALIGKTLEDKLSVCQQDRSRKWPFGSAMKSNGVLPNWTGSKAGSAS